MKKFLRLHFVAFALFICLSDFCEADEQQTFKLSTPAFHHRTRIPEKCTQAGKSISPELFWEGAPEGTKSFVLICRDAEALPRQDVRWIMYNIPANVDHLAEGIGRVAALPNGAFQGMNDLNRLGYDGPSSMIGSKHHYFFTLYALDEILTLKPAVSYDKLQCVMRGYIIGKTSIRGYYKYIDKHINQGPNPHHDVSMDQEYEICYFYSYPKTSVKKQYQANHQTIYPNVWSAQTKSSFDVLYTADPSGAGVEPNSNRIEAAN